MDGWGAKHQTHYLTRSLCKSIVLITSLPINLKCLTSHKLRVVDEYEWCDCVSVLIGFSERLICLLWYLHLDFWNFSVVQFWAVWFRALMRERWLKQVGLFAESVRIPPLLSPPLSMFYYLDVSSEIYQWLMECCGCVHLRFYFRVPCLRAQICAVN